MIPKHYALRPGNALGRLAGDVFCFAGAKPDVVVRVRRRVVQVQREHTGIRSVVEVATA
jgi:hypothetical protein